MERYENWRLYLYIYLFINKMRNKWTDHWVNRLNYVFNFFFRSIIFLLSYFHNCDQTEWQWSLIEINDSFRTNRSQLFIFFWMSTAQFEFVIFFHAKFLSLKLNQPVRYWVQILFSWKLHIFLLIGLIAALTHKKLTEKLWVLDILCRAQSKTKIVVFSF